MTRTPTVSTDSVAQDHPLLAFARQIEEFRLQQLERHFASFGRQVPPMSRAPSRRSLGDRLPRRARGEGVSIEHAARWLEVCEILCRSADDFDHETRKGWVIACRLLGLRWNEVQDALRDTRDFGHTAAAQVWAPFLGLVDARFLGVVYTAHAIGRAEIIKIGFTGDANRRMQELTWTQHAHVQLISTRPGTMLHEWALHHLILHPVEPEWYPVGQLPAFMLTSEAA